MVQKSLGFLGARHNGGSFGIVVHLSVWSMNARSIGSFLSSNNHISLLRLHILPRFFCSGHDVAGERHDLGLIRPKNPRSRWRSAECYWT